VEGATESAGRPSEEGGTNGDPAEARRSEPRPFDVRSFSLTGLFVLGLLYTLHTARGFLVPVVLAVLLFTLLNPLVRRLKRMRIPAQVSAVLILFVLGSALYLGIQSLLPPATQWIRAAPRSLDGAQKKIERLLRPVRQMSESADKVAEATEIDTHQETVKVEIQDKGMGATMFGETQAVLTAAFLVALLLFLLLSSGDLFLTKVIRVLPRLRDKKRAVQIARETEAQISTYLLTTTLINVAFGIAVGVAMKLLGMPNPVLWGVVATVTNYVPFVGAVACTAALMVVALIHFEGAGRSLAVGAVFQALNVLEGSVLTPHLVGPRVSLNPVVTFVAVVFWSWLWGIPGAVLAVPITATLKIVCDHSDRMAPLGEFLGT
jgi:predicted PurR-regulated permease PerM